MAKKICSGHEALGGVVPAIAILNPLLPKGSSNSVHLI